MKIFLFFFFLPSNILTSALQCCVYFPSCGIQDVEFCWTSFHWEKVCSTVHAKDRKLIVTTKMRERYFVENLWVSYYHFLGVNICVYTFSIWTWIRGQLVNSLPKELLEKGKKKAISANSCKQMPESVWQKRDIEM